jgi:hypothetical protein
VKNVTKYQLHSVLAKTSRIDYYERGDGTKTPPKCSSLSPPLAKASAELRSSAEAFLTVHNCAGPALQYTKYEGHALYLLDGSPLQIIFISSLLEQVRKEWEEQ